jgi:hypothetical protein
MLALDYASQTRRRKIDLLSLLASEAELMLHSSVLPKRKHDHHSMQSDFV